MNSDNTLLISEDFYSIQGEGKTIGVPAYFIRLANCNLSCGAKMKTVNEFRRGTRTEEAGTFEGDLHKQGVATWTCDTIPVWAKGEEREFEYLISRWKEQGIYEDIRTGLIHIVWTGGEPLMPMHQKSIVNFMYWWHTYDLSEDQETTAGWTPYVEIETNGTFEIQIELYKFLNQINCSPKLANSGMRERQRINSAAIKSILQHDNYQFKFVISSEEDIKEFMRDFVDPFNIQLEHVCCMPGLDSQENFHERTRFVAEMAIKYKFIGLTRLHVSAWNQLTGV